MADLIDRDLTIHELEAFKESCIANLMRMSFDDITDVVKDIPAVNRWIPCSERLPEEGQDVIIYIAKRWKENPIQIAHILHDNILWELSDGEFYFSKDEVSHWMPLPEPPESEVQNG